MIFGGEWPSGLGISPEFLVEDKSRTNCPSAA
jgi:hypothetical protein